MATTEGLFRYDSLTKKARQYKFNKVDSTGLPQKEVFAVFEIIKKTFGLPLKIFLASLLILIKAYFNRTVIKHLYLIIKEYGQ